jgi:lipoprotein-anchoring transpeptidase ErfK/SrfK
VERSGALAQPANLHISLSENTLEARDEAGNLIAHFPVSIARLAEKRPEGELHVTVVIANPDYTFDPDVFPESAEAREIGHKLVLPPGPNNPVGVAWIGLDRPGYGIHGTPTPEQVGRTESHGCFRLANWDARTLLEIAYVGLPVIVDP